MNGSSSNPFSTRHIQPGEIGYIFPDLTGHLAQLIERLTEQGWRGAIVGPHGSGKSTLLASLIPLLREAGQAPLLIALRDGQRKLPIDLAKLDPAPPPGAVIVVDGYEQLSRFNRWRLDRLCDRRKWGLLVTAHDAVGLPVIYTTSATPELAEQIVARLAGPEADALGGDVSACFSATGGNMRETLFALYDVYEQRRARPGS